MAFNAYAVSLCRVSVAILLEWASVTRRKETFYRLLTPDEGGDLLFDVQRDDVDAASVFPDCDTPKMKRIGPNQ